MFMINFGDKIELKEFKDLEPGDMTVLKKLIGNHANGFHDFQKLSLHLKNVHKKEQDTEYQVNGMLVKDDKQYEAESTNYNLFFVISEVLENLKSQCSKG